MRGTALQAAWILGLLAGVFPSPAGGQVLNLGHLEPGQNRLVTTTGLDPAVLVAIGYTRTATLGERPLALSLEVSLPVAQLDIRDYRARVGGQMPVLHLGRLCLGAQGSLISRGTRNDIFDAHGFGADLSLSLGYYGGRGLVALELGFDKALATHISHREWYRDYFYSRAVDGWYSSPGGTWHGGALAGVGLGRFELGMRIGLRRSEQGNELSPPVGGTLSVAYVF